MFYCKKFPGLEKNNKEEQHCNWILKKNNKRFITCILVQCKLKVEYSKFDELYTFDRFNYLGLFMDFPFSWHFSKITELDKSKSLFSLLKEYRKTINSKRKEGLFICGSYRSGKYFVAVTLLNCLISLKKPKKVVFINCVNIIKYLQEIYFNNKDEFDDLIELYSNVEILVLDDFGINKMNLFLIILFLKFWIIV